MRWNANPIVIATHILVSNVCEVIRIDSAVCTPNGVSTHNADQNIELPIIVPERSTQDIAQV